MTSSSERNFQLRWESVGDQWWYATPIDWAAANGLYDLVRELLHLDTNLLIKLTSLRRLRRLETVWDDDDDDDHRRRSLVLSENRARVAKSLLAACEVAGGGGGGENSLLRAGYGGWLLYTAAAAGDAAFVGEILGRDPLLVYGEGEYGVGDLLYAAARGRSREVFRMLVGLAAEGGGGGGRRREELRWEVVNRAGHAAARGGNWEVLREIVEEEERIGGGGGGGGGGVLRFVDDQGCCLLHSASATGQLQVVKYLIESFDIITCTDNQGNTALHVAAYRGHSAVVKALTQASHSLTTSRNSNGDTFLHMAVSGFRAPGFRRLDKLIGLVEDLVNLDDVIVHVINSRNDDGRTALHVAVAENVHVDLVRLLMSVPSINLNVRDFDGMTPLDVLKRRPRSASSEILIRRLISAGAIFNSRDRTTRKALVSELRNRGIGTSPGTSFRVPDSEIFLYAGIEAGDDLEAKLRTLSEVSCSGEEKHLNNFFRKWPKTGKDSVVPIGFEGVIRNVPLRQIYSKKEPKANDFPSPSTKMRFAAGLMHGVIKTLPTYLSTGSADSSPPRISDDVSVGFGKKACGSSNLREENEEELLRRGRRRNESLDEKLIMNEYFCFGAQESADQHVVEDSMSCNNEKKNYGRSYTNYSSVVV